MLQEIHNADIGELEMPAGDPPGYLNISLLDSFQDLPVLRQGVVEALMRAQGDGTKRLEEVKDILNQVVDKLIPAQLIERIMKGGINSGIVIDISFTIAFFHRRKIHGLHRQGRKLPDQGRL
jgi:hypothetical protein